MVKKPTFAHYLSADSVFFTIPFRVKSVIFFLLGALVLSLPHIYFYGALLIALLSLLIAIGFLQTHRSLGKFFFGYFLIFSSFRIFFSTIPGGGLLLERPRGTYVTTNTLSATLLSLLKSYSILLLGVSFIAVCSEEELIDFLFSLRMNKKAVLLVSIALNTFNFTLKDIETIDEALLSRQYNNRWVIKKIKKIYYIGTNVVLTHIKKMQILSESFHLKEELYK